MRTETLIVVDVQPSFTKNNTLIAEISREINKAVIKRFPIIFLEYVDYGKTSLTLRRLVANYDRTFFATKDRQSGAPEVRAIVKQNKLPHKTFRVSGVYTNCCVRETVTDLSRMYLKSQIKVLSKACRNTYQNDIPGWDPIKEYGIECMSKLPNVSIVK